VEVAEHERRRLGEDRRQRLFPGGDVVVARTLVRRPAADRRHVPVGKEQRLVQQPLPVIRGKAARQRSLRRQAMQVDQYVDRQPVERRLVGAGREQAREGVVAEIFQQQQSGGFVGGEDGGRAEA
jgi:hypothetical protein